jgi:hypothetical protein
MAHLVGVQGCSYCESTSGVWGCPIHGPNASGTMTVPGPGVAEVEALHHVHRWHYDGQQQALDYGSYPTVYQRELIYHCDEHDPPLVRLVSRP